MISSTQGEMKPKLTPELAEFIGILFGDGYMNKTSDNHYFIEIAGHSVKDKEYHINYIRPLIQALFDYESKLIFRKDQNTVYNRISSKRIFLILDELGMPKGKKRDLHVPFWIKLNNLFFKAFLRGLYDTDGSVILRNRGYHSISLALKNKNLILEIKSFLEELGYFVSYNKDVQHDKRGFISTMFCIRINQKRLIIKFYEQIGSSNQYKLKRLQEIIINGTAGIS